MIPKSLKQFVLSGALASSVLLTGTMLSAPTALADGTCVTMLNPIMSDLRANPNSHSVLARFATNEAGRQLVTYVEAKLVLGTLSSGHLALVTPYAAQQFLNARPGERWPFDPNVYDQVKLSIDSTSGAMAVTLLSWGNTVRTISRPSCNDGVLHGVEDGAPFTLWTGTFVEQ